MGSIEVRNPLLSKKLKRTETRLLIIDDNQIRYNQIRDLLTSHDYQVDAVLPVSYTHLTLPTICSV